MTPDAMWRAARPELRCTDGSTPSLWTAGSPCPSAPAVALEEGSPGQGWSMATRLSAWLTGPDPFEPTQRPLGSPGPRHDTLGERLASRRAPVRSWGGTPERPAVLPARDAAWLGWRLAEPGAELEAMEVGDRSRCRGWIVLGHHPRQIRILDLQAEDRVAHYALLKAARKRSWERGGLPVILLGERMSRRYALSAGLVPTRSRLAIWTRGRARLDHAWEADR